MTYTEVTNRDAVSYTSQAQLGYKRKITNITIHWWGKPEWGQTWEQVMSFFCDTPTTQTSAHVVASAGQIGYIVAPQDVAWANGSWSANTQSFTIECNPRMSQGDMDTVAEFIADFWISFGSVLPITEHRDWYATECSGVWKKGDVFKRASQFYEAKKNNKPLPATANSAVATSNTSIKKEASVSAEASEIWKLLRPGVEGKYHNGSLYNILNNISTQTQQVKDAITPGVPGVKFEGQLYAAVTQLKKEQEKTNQLLEKLISKIEVG